MNLKALQTQFSESLFYQNEQITEQIKETQSVTPAQRLQIYRNSFIMGISEALSITYQHTLALVGEDFFNAASRDFILMSPPLENNIMTYGLGFNKYLQSLPQLASMPYIHEMARFEWLLEQTSNMQVEEKTLDLVQLSQVPEAEMHFLQFTIPTQVSLFDSEQNINHLYQMIIDDAVTETDLNTPCYLALKKAPDFRIEIIPLSENEFHLLQQIQAGKTLGQITPADLQQQLPILLEKTLVNGFSITKDKS